MSSWDAFEFQCPQFVDFTDMNSSPKLESQLGGFSPDILNPTPLNIQTEKPSRRKAYPDHRMVYPLSSGTPICHSSNATDSAKWRFPGLSKRLSRSDSCVNLSSRHLKTANENTNPPLVLKQHNRSLSESDIKAKARIGPTTPMCLKRTLCKAKVKKLKTSEELELEKIAQLQKQMHQHLRANEVAMKRLKMKTRPCTAQKKTIKPEVQSRKNFQTNLPKDKVFGKMNGPKQNKSPFATREGMNANGGFVSKAEGERIFMVRLNQVRATRCKPVAGQDCQQGINTKEGFATQPERAKIIMPRLNQLQETVCKPLSGKQCNIQNSNQSSASNTDGLRSIENKPKAYTAHHGLLFLANNQKATACKPFNFNRKDKPAPSSTPEKDNPIKDRVKMRVPGTCYKFTDKENNKYQKSFTDVKKAKDLKKGTSFFASTGNRI